MPQGVTGFQPTEVLDSFIEKAFLCLQEVFCYALSPANIGEEVHKVRNLQIKEQKVKELTEKFQKAQAAILTSYIGITVEEDTELRKKMREAGVEYKVVKNTLTLRAAKEAGYSEIEKYLVGPVAIAFSYDDPTAPARVLANFAENHKVIELKAGIVQGQIFDTQQVKELAKIPPREVLIAKILGSFKAPLSNLVYVLNAIKEKKEANA